MLWNIAILDGDNGDDDDDEDEEEGFDDDDEDEEANDITGVTSTAAKARAWPDISSRLEIKVMILMMRMMMRNSQSHVLNPATARALDREEWEGLLATTHECHTPHFSPLWHSELLYVYCVGLLHLCSVQCASTQSEGRFMQQIKKHLLSDRERNKKDFLWLLMSAIPQIPKLFYDHHRLHPFPHEWSSPAEVFSWPMICDDGGDDDNEECSLDQWCVGDFWLKPSCAKDQTLLTPCTVQRHVWSPQSLSWSSSLTSASPYDNQILSFQWLHYGKVCKIKVLG